MKSESHEKNVVDPVKEAQLQIAKDIAKSRLQKPAEVKYRIIAKDDLSIPTGHTWTKGLDYEVIEMPSIFILASNEGQMNYTQEVKRYVFGVFEVPEEYLVSEESYSIQELAEMLGKEESKVNKANEAQEHCEVLNNEVSFTQEEKDKLKQIYTLFNQVEDIFNSFDHKTKDKIHEYHDEFHTIPHCFRWGMQAVEELIIEPTKGKEEK